MIIVTTVAKANSIFTCSKAARQEIFMIICDILHEMPHFVNYGKFTVTRIVFQTNQLIIIIICAAVIGNVFGKKGQLVVCYACTVYIECVCGRTHDI